MHFRGFKTEFTLQSYTREIDAIQSEDLCAIILSGKRYAEPVNRDNLAERQWLVKTVRGSD